MEKEPAKIIIFRDRAEKILGSRYGRNVLEFRVRREGRHTLTIQEIGELYAKRDRRLTNPDGPEAG